MIAICNFWHNARGFGFVTDPATGTQYFLHIRNFEYGKSPVVGAYISFVLGAPLKSGQPLQCMNAKFATAEEIRKAEVNVGVSALATPQNEVRG